MTSTPVSDVGMYLNNVSTKNQPTNNGESQKESFTLVMNKASLQNVSQSVHSARTSATNDSERTVMKKEDVTQTDKVTTTKIDEKSETMKEPKTEDALVDETTMKALEEKAKKLLEEVAKELGVETEDIEKVLEQLGLTTMDLFSQENLTTVILGVTGTESAADLLTNEGLYSAVQNLTDTMNQMLTEVANDLDILPQELMQQVQQLTEHGSDENVPVISESDIFTEGETPKAPVIEVSGAQEEVKNQTLENGTADSNETVMDETKTETQEVLQGEKPADKQQPENSQGQGNEDAQGNLFAQQTNDQTIGSFSESISEPMQPHGYNTQQIMEQIMDYLKVEIKPDMSQLEMQLHPESLGTLNIQVSNKNGLVTAQFTTQDENVKHVIESQLVQLKDTLNEQGIKVQAIEVNVSARSFERNLEQNSGENTGDEAQAQQKKGTRKLNLNDLDLDDLSEDIEADDSIKIAADMMARNGNTLDYLI